MLEKTFEEYLTKIKIWYPEGGLNPQQIEQERERYEALKIRAKDQNYFEPIENDSLFKELIEAHLNTIVLHENDFIISICPSFQESYLFHILNSASETSIVKGKLNNQGNLAPIAIDATTGKSLNAVLNKAFSSARKKRIRYLVLDGIVYCITRKINNKYETITKHSPAENSWTERLFSLFEGSYFENKEKIEALNNELTLLLKWELG